MESMTGGLVVCLERLHSEGFILPLTFSAIAANGVVFAGRYIEKGNGSECEFIHEAAEPLRLPLYFLFVDARGEAAGFIVAPQDNYFVRWPSIPRPTEGH